MFQGIKILSKIHKTFFNLVPIKVPVLMYHSVGDHNNEKTPWSFLSVPTDIFENCVKYLYRKKFTTLTLQELYDYKNYNTSLPPNPIILTFDDGFLDNWINSYPILKKYGMKATIFVNPEFVNPLNVCRQTLEDVWAGRIKKNDLRSWGYLSWREMRKMEEIGVMDIQSHSLTHTWYFKNSKIVDFHHPNDEYYWLAWNADPESKYKWLTDYQENRIEYGTPIYEYGESIITRRYFDDQNLKHVLVQNVEKKGVNKFFQSKDWRDELFMIARHYMEDHKLNDHYETNEEYIDRVRMEIFDSKKIIEEKLDKTVSFICWPGGKFNYIAGKLAKDAGYLATTKGNKLNVFGEELDRIHRIGAYLDKRKFGSLASNKITLLFFISQINSYKGVKIYSFLINFSRLMVKFVKFIKKAMLILCIQK